MREKMDAGFYVTDLDLSEKSLGFPIYISGDYYLFIGREVLSMMREADHIREHFAEKIAWGDSDKFFELPVVVSLVCAGQRFPSFRLIQSEKL